MRRGVLLFTKPAVPGRVKTRLSPAVGGEGAAALHRAFLDDTLATLRAGPWSLRVLWALEGDEAPPQIADGIRSMRQEGDGLGERLAGALREAAAEHDTVAAVGSDHPELDASTVAEAFRRLEAGADVVLGPVDDGGYCLIALRSALFDGEPQNDAQNDPQNDDGSALFHDIPWSTDSVLETTRVRCAARGLAVELLEPGHDIDRPADLDALVARLAADPERPACRATRALLRRWGRLGPIPTPAEETR